MIPKYFVIRKELPKTLVGKINYKELEKEKQILFFYIVKKIKKRYNKIYN